MHANRNWAIEVCKPLLGKRIDLSSSLAAVSYTHLDVYKRQLRALAAQGMDTEQMRKLDFARLRAAQRDGAAAEVKTFILLDRISSEENIAVSDEELDNELQIAALQAREPFDALKAVSYTHLDVYKRQRYSRPGGQRYNLSVTNSCGHGTRLARERMPSEWRVDDPVDAPA